MIGDLLEDNMSDTLICVPFTSRCFSVAANPQLTEILSAGVSVLKVIVCAILRRLVLVGS